MAIHRQRRENLLREATAYHARYLFKRQPADTLQRFEFSEVFVGYRLHGGCSLFFDEDPVLHVDSQHALRQLYWKGEKLIAQRGNLVQLAANHRGGRVELTRRALDAASQDALRDECFTLLDRFLQAVQQRTVALDSCVNSDRKTGLQRVVESLKVVLQVRKFAESPRI